MRLNGRAVGQVVCPAHVAAQASVVGVFNMVSAPSVPPTSHLDLLLAIVEACVRKGCALQTYFPCPGLPCNGASHSADGQAQSKQSSRSQSVKLSRESAQAVTRDRTKSWSVQGGRNAERHDQAVTQMQYMHWPEGESE
jgi:hypothetical protein